MPDLVMMDLKTLANTQKELENVLPQLKKSDIPWKPSMLVEDLLEIKSEIPFQNLYKPLLKMMNSNVNTLPNQVDMQLPDSSVSVAELLLKKKFLKTKLHYMLMMEFTMVLTKSPLTEFLSMDKDFSKNRSVRISKPRFIKPMKTTNKKNQNQVNTLPL